MLTDQLKVLRQAVLKGNASKVTQQLRSMPAFGDEHAIAASSLLGEALGRNFVAIAQSLLDLSLIHI